MNIAILRRRGLGKGSCLGIQRFLLEDFNRDVNIIMNDNIPKDNFDICIRWGCTSTIIANHIVNKAKFIHLANNKKESRMLLQNSGVSVPRSIFSKENDLTINYPLIGRQEYHSQGRNLKVINNLEELENDNTSAYWSEYISKEKEFRVYTFFGKVILVAEKVPTEKGKKEIAWNRYLGNSSFENVRWNEWPIKVCVEALKAIEVIPIDFSGVDVMVKGNNVYILELNSAMSLTSDYRKQCFSKAFNWLFGKVEELGKLPEHYPLPDNVRNYRDLIHSAIKERENDQ